MTMQNEMLIKALTDEYAEKLFYFCLKKTGDSVEAEDLTSDILVSILSALQKGTEPSNFSAYVWQIARNRYAAWAKRRRRERESVSGTDITEYEPADENSDIEEQTIYNEQLALLRRELAFVSSDYRNILIAYYFENKHVREIAEALGLPKGTVESKLHRARKILKEGMEMAKEFGVRSYKPEEINFVNNCSAFGDYGQPWTILRHAMYKNIFLEAYDNPSTAEELALELGVALPYMEDELNYLVEQTFLVKDGNKYETDFPIISRETQEKVAAKNASLTAKITSLLEKLLDTFHAACVRAGISYYGDYVGYEDAKWTLLMRTYDWFRYPTHARLKYRERPNDGRWEIVGYQISNRPHLPFVGLHGCFSTRDDLPSVNFDQFKFMHGDIHLQTPEYVSHEEGYALQLVAKGQWKECSKGMLDNLLQYGYIRTDGEGYVPNILIFDGRLSDKYVSELCEEDRNEIRSLADQIRKLFDELAEHSNKVTMSDLPTRFRKNESICALACSNVGFDRSDVLEQALADGWIKHDENTSKVIGAYLIL